MCNNLRKVQATFTKFAPEMHHRGGKSNRIKIMFQNKTRRFIMDDTDLNLGDLDLHLQGHDLQDHNT